MRTGSSERLEAMAWRAGVLATGLMLLRVVDPEFKTSGQESGKSISGALLSMVASIYYVYAGICFCGFKMDHFRYQCGSFSSVFDYRAGLLPASGAEIK